MQRLGSISRLREFYSGQTLTALIDLPFALLFLLMIAFLGGWLVLGLLAVFCLLARYAGTMLKSRLESRSRNDDRKANFLITTLSGIHTGKAMGMEKQLLRRFEEHQAQISGSSYQVARASGFAANLSASFSQLSQICTAAAGCLFVMSGNLSMGGLTACALRAGRALQPVQRVMGTWLRLQDFTVAREQAASIFAMPAMPCEKEPPLATPEGKLSVQNLSFGYSPDQLLLKNASLRAEPGEVIAKQLNRFGPVLSHAALFSLLIGVLSLAPAAFNMAMYDKVIGANSAEGLPMLLAGAMLALSAEMTMRHLRNRRLSWFGARIDHYVSCSVFERLMFLPPHYTERASVSSQLARLKDFEAVREFFTGPLATLFFELPLVFVYLLAMAVIGGWLAVVPLALIFAYALLIWIMNSRLRQSGQAASVASTRRQEFCWRRSRGCARSVLPVSKRCGRSAVGSFQPTQPLRPSAPPSMRSFWRSSPSC